MIGRIALVLVALVLAVGAVGCGGDDDNGTATPTEETTTTDTTEETTTTDETDDGDDSFAAGRTVFMDNCGECHTLSDAGTSGSIGPALDGAGLSQDAVEQQVRNGGGAMPAFEGQLSDQEIEDVSEYVADASGG